MGQGEREAMCTASVKDGENRTQLWNLEKQANKRILKKEFLEQLDFIKIKEYSEQTSHYLSTFYRKISH